MQWMSLLATESEHSHQLLERQQQHGDTLTGSNRSVCIILALPNLDEAWCGSGVRTGQHNGDPLRKPPHKTAWHNNLVTSDFIFRPHGTTVHTPTSLAYWTATCE